MQNAPAEYRAAFQGEVLDRAVIGAQITCVLVIILALLFGLLDRQMYPDAAREMFAVRLGITGTTGAWLLLIRWLLRRGTAAARIRPISWGIFATPVLGLDVIILMAGGGQSPYYAGLCLILLGLFVIMPWGVLEMGVQATAIWLQYLVVMLALGPDIGDGRLFINNNTFMASMVVIGLTWTYVARDLRVREFLARARLAEKEAALAREARVSGALARVGREMIESIQTPEVLDRLCALGTTLLRCDVSQTWLWQRDEDVYEPVASYGHDPSDWEMLRLIELPRARIAELLSRLGAEEIVEMTAEVPEASLPLVQQDLARIAFLALRRGSDLIGCQVLGYRHHRGPLNEEEKRIAGGVAQLASMALEHARTVEELTRAKEVKEHFVAVLSHELRNPITVLGGYHEMLLDGAAGELGSEQADLVRSAQRCTRELNALISATLDLSRFEARQIQLDIEEVDVRDLVNEVVRDLRVPSDKPDLRLHRDVDPALPCLRTDRFKLRMVLNNLVGNALKYTERGRVELRARGRDGGVELCVCDTGVGISSEELPVIFEPFRQVGVGAGRRRDGVGLGLHIVKRLVEVLGGTIAVESEVGRGSTFSVKLRHRAGDDGKG